jgi:hypothetical protein
VLECNEYESLRFSHRVWAAAVFQVPVVRGLIKGGVGLIFRIKILGVEVHVVSNVLLEVGADCGKILRVNHVIVAQKNEYS